MKAILRRWSRLYALIINRCFILYKGFEALFANKTKITILFSDQESWKTPLRLGFNFTQHRLTFADFSADNIKQYDLAVPLVMNDLMCLSQARDSWVDSLIPIPTPNVILLCNDKVLLNQTLIKQGFERFIPSMNQPLSYPYIVKKRIDVLGVNSYLITNKEDEKKYADLTIDNNYFTQAFIEGDTEYTTHILFKNKKIRYALTIKFYFDTTTPIKGKDEVLFTRVCWPSHLKLFSKALKAIDFEGLCCINYKVRGNKLFILEINPRIGGSAKLLFFTFMNHIGLPGDNPAAWWQKYKQ